MLWPIQQGFGALSAWKTKNLFLHRTSAGLLSLIRCADFLQTGCCGMPQCLKNEGICSCTKPVKSESIASHPFAKGAKDGVPIPESSLSVLFAYGARLFEMTLTIKNNGVRYFRRVCELWKLLVATVLILGGVARAGTVAGKITTASSGAVGNGTLTFSLTQTAVAPSTATPSAPASIAASGVNCWTDSQGNVVGLAGGAAIAAAVLVSVSGGGVLPAVIHYVKYTWSVSPNGALSTGESEPSAERSIVPGGGGTITVQVPVNVPASATAMNVYIGTASGADKLQGSVSVTNSTMASG